MKKNILLINDGSNQHRKIAKHILEEGFNPILLDTRRILAGEYKICLNYEKGMQDGFIISKDGTRIELESISAFYVRGYTFNLIAEHVVDIDARRWVEREAKSNLISIIELQNKKVINSPIKSMIAGDKITQMLVANNVGFETPRTLITNSPDDLRSFRKTTNHGVVFKSTCPPYINTLEAKNPKTIYTNLLKKQDYELDREIASNLSLFQEHVLKKYELRVIVVGEKVFACKIESQKNLDTKIDWRRYNLDKTPHEKYYLPDYIKDKLLKIIKKYDLLYGAFDLIVTPDEKYIFLELNPDGIYDWVEELTGFEISKSIAKELVKPI